MKGKSIFFHSPMCFLGFLKRSWEIRPINLEGKDVPIWIIDRSLISTQFPEASSIFNHSNFLSLIISLNKEKILPFSAWWDCCYESNKEVEKQLSQTSNKLFYHPTYCIVKEKNSIGKHGLCGCWDIRNAFRISFFPYII